MDLRTMPVATFRCDVCGKLETLTLTKLVREEAQPDVLRPHPHHDGTPMRCVQIAYYDAAEAN